MHGESDGLPGLIVDRYGDYLVTQFLAAGVEFHRDMIVELLVKVTGIPNVYERSDLDVRTLEGLPERTGVLAGSAPPDSLVILENGMQFKVDLHAWAKDRILSRSTGQS